MSDLSKGFPWVPFIERAIANLKEGEVVDFKILGVEPNKNPNLHLQLQLSEADLNKLQTLLAALASPAQE